MKHWMIMSLVLLFSTFNLMAEPVASSAAPAKDKFYLFLLVGQSNMAGRGFVEAQDKVANPRVLTLTKDGKWVSAVDPIHFDKKEAGCGLGRTFGILVAEKNHDVTVGLIPCACGGSPISTWVPGGYHNQTKSHPYDDAIKRARQAMAEGTLKGILWHQGEGDCGVENSKKYEARLMELIQRFRTELNAPDVPVIIGQLGQLKPWGVGARNVNQALSDVAAKTKNGAFVKSDALTCNPDKIHFNATSQREFGHRYFAAWLKVAEPKK
ncbi:MAG: sialate O-acetylesterase [Victivallaceae bacterium]